MDHEGFVPTAVPKLAAVGPATAWAPVARDAELPTNWGVVLGATFEELQTGAEVGVGFVSVADCVHCGLAWALVDWVTGLGGVFA